MLNKYQELIKETAVYPRQLGIAYCSLGLTGEAGEIANKVKKMYRDNDLSTLMIRSDGSYEKFIEERKNDIKAELGDVLWYVTALAEEFDLSLEEIMEYNMHKLLDRRARNVLQGSGDNR